LHNAIYTYIFVLDMDNQAAIKALLLKLNKSCHHIAANIIQSAAGIKKTRGEKYTLTVQWTERHS
jgi:hypothetical protein